MRAERVFAGNRGFVCSSGVERAACDGGIHMRAGPSCPGEENAGAAVETRHA